MHTVTATAIEQLAINFGAVRLRTGPDHWVQESRMTGTVAGSIEIDGERVAAPGARADVDCVDVIEARDGLVRRKDTYLDAVTFQRQMGLA